MFIYASIITFTGVSLNLLLIYTMASVETKMFGIVQRIFYITAVLNIFSLISYYGLIPILYCYEGHIVLLSFNFNEIPFLSNLLIKNIFISNILNVQCLSQCYFYRYLLMTRKSLYNLFVTTKAVILNIMFMISWTALSVVSVSVVFHPTAETLDFLDGIEPLKKFNVKRNLKFAASLQDIVSDYLRIISFFVYFTLLTALILAIFFFVHQILKKLEDLKRDQDLSRSTISAHERLLRVLLMQTFLPVISFLIPSSALGVLILSQTTSSELLTFSVACLFPISITLYPISIVYFVDHYRKFVFQLLFCKKS